MKMINLLLLTGLGLFLAVDPSLSQELSVPVTVREPIGVVRQAWPASGGIPFKQGQVKSVAELCLVDQSGTPVPAQFSKLAGYEDGSVQWALVDLLSDVAANGEAEYTIKLGKAVASSPALKIDETDETITIDTGAAQLVVGKKAFTLFDKVSVNGKPLITGGDVTVTGGKGRWYVQDRKTKEWTEHIDDSHDGKTYKTGAPNRIKWEYRGPQSATLRVDGDYVGAADEKWLSYTARITAWANSGLVRVRFAIRNSDPAVGNDAFIARASLGAKLAVTSANQGSGDDWIAGGDGSLGLLLQNRHTAGVYWGPGTYLISKFSSVGYYGEGWKGLYGQNVSGSAASVEIVSPGPTLGTPEKQHNGDHGFTRDGVFALADRSHKESEVWFDFYTGTRNAEENLARAKGCRSKLLVVAPGEWYSETEALGIGRFGTLKDEIATYKQWGWKGADDESRYPKDPHQPFAFVPSEMFHNTTEDDSVQAYLLQFVRTGERGCFDWGEAFNGLYRGHAIYRTDWGPRWDLAAAEAKRERNGQGFDWYGPHVFEWADSRMHDCHHYGRGIFDYYCLTGDTDSLEAGLDLAEEVTASLKKHKPGASFAFKRSFGRQYLTALRAYQVMRNDKWKAICDQMASIVLEAENWQPELNLYHQSLGIKNSYFAKEWATGHFDIDSMKSWERIFKPIPKKIDNYLTEQKITAYYERGKVMARKGAGEEAPVWEVTYLTQLFELSACHLALDRYAVLFNSEPMKKRVVEVADGVARHYWSPVVNYMIGSPWFSWPDKDKTLDPYYWSDATESRISGYATRYTADMFARAYCFSKDPKHLELAKLSWDRGSKRTYNSSAPMAGPDEVGVFAHIFGVKNDTLLECSARLFYVTQHLSR